MSRVSLRKLELRPGLRGALFLTSSAIHDGGIEQGDVSVVVSYASLESTQDTNIVSNPMRVC